MPDLRESFPSLEDVSTAEGKALAVVQEGDAVTAKNGSLAFGFKDSTGNAVAPQLSAAGKLPVVGPLTDTELRASPVPVTMGNVTGNGKKARGSVAGNAALTTVASLTLAASKIYENLDFIVSCTRDALFQVILSDNAVETIIAEAIVGSGQMSFQGKLQEAEIASGATGTQLLLIKAKNLNGASLSDFHASLSVVLAN